MASSVQRTVYDYSEGQPNSAIDIKDQFQQHKPIGKSITNTEQWHAKHNGAPRPVVEEVSNTGLHLPALLSHHSALRGLSRCSSEPTLPPAHRSQSHSVGSEEALECIDSSSDADDASGDLGTDQTEGDDGECFDNPIYAEPAELRSFRTRDSVKENTKLSNGFRSSAEYENMKIILDGPPPIPQQNEIPVKSLEDCWQEFEDALGRRYYFNSQFNLSSWKPPRKVMHLPAIDVEEPDGLTANELHSKVSPTPESNDIAERHLRQSHSPMLAELEQRHFLTDVSNPRHVKFMPRLNRMSSMIENDKKLDESLGLLAYDQEKENAEEEKRRTATLPLPKRPPPSKNFLELRQKIANKVSVPERTVRTRSVMVLNENHLSDFDKVGNGMKNSKTLPTMLLGKTWTSDKSGSLQGFLNVTKYGKKLKKQWVGSFVILNDSSLYIFRPPFVVEQSPEIFMDLLGATVRWCREKSNRKNVFEVAAADGFQLLIQDDDKSKADQWVSSIVQAIAKLSIGAPDDLSPIKVLPTPTEDRLTKTDRPISPRLARILGRQKSMKQPADDVEEQQPLSCLPMPASSGHKKKKSVDEMETGDIKIRKIKIIERLKNFFSRRPSLESLKAKGIIRDGPVFGCNFSKLCEHEKDNIPSFLRRCVAAIEKKDLKTDGIYRVSGNLSQVQKLRFQIDQDKYSGMETEEDVNVLTGLLKLFFRELKEPMIPFQLYDALMKANKIPEKSAKDKRFRELIGQLPKPNAETLKFLFTHLYNVSKFVDHNRMHLQNLAIVFGPTLMWSEVPSTNLAMDMLCQNQVVEYLLLHFHTLFEHIP